MIETILLKVEHHSPDVARAIAATSVHERLMFVRTDVTERGSCTFLDECLAVHFRHVADFPLLLRRHRRLTARLLVFARGCRVCSAEISPGGLSVLDDPARRDGNGSG